LKPGLCVRLVRFVILAPEPRQHRRCHAGNPLIALSEFPEPPLLEKGRFISTTIARGGAVTLTMAQLAMLLEGLDWRMPTPIWKPEITV